MKQRHLRVYERDHIYPQSLSYYLRFLKFSPQQYPYLANYWEVMTYSKDYFWWARDTDYLERAFRKWFKGWLTSSKLKADIFGRYRRDHLRFGKLFTNLITGQISKLSISTLSKRYRKAVAAATEHMAYAEYTCDLFDDFFGILFREFLEKKCGVQLNVADLTAIMHPAPLSASARYRRKLLRASLSAQKNTALLQIRLAKKYSWIRMSWDGSNEITPSVVASDLKKMRRSTIYDRRRELSGLDNFSRRVGQERRRLLKKYNLSLIKIRPYFSLLDAFHIFHDYRKEIQMRSNQIIFRILRAIPSRLGLSYRDLLFYTTDEVDNLLSGGGQVSRKIISERQKGFTMIIQQGNITTYTGVKALEKLKTMVLDVQNRLSKSQDLRGSPASAGTVVGRALVVASAAEANRMIRSGDILITSMTVVDYLPAMRKAAAIVTDDGGVTCHAAVVSRELGIPCVVGTKLATRMLRTGMLVEVNADHGVVKILEKF